MIIGNVNLTFTCIVFLVALAILVIVPSALSLLSHGRIIGGSMSVVLFIEAGIFLLALAFSLTLDSMLSMKSYENIAGLDDHYGITISTSSDGANTGYSKKSKGLQVLPGNSSKSISFTDGSGRLVNGTLVINGNKATIYDGSLEYTGE